MRLLLAAVAASVLASCSGRPAAFYGTTMRSVRATDFTLVRQDGRPFRLADQRGKEVVLFFGYTHCPDICPTTMARLARMYHSLPESVKERIRVVFITIDPQRDTPAVLARYVALFDPRFIGLTGTQAALDRVYTAYGVLHERVAAHGAVGYLMAHSSTIYLIDMEGALRVLHDWNADLAKLRSDVLRLAS
jgi:protein SCO1/2